MCLLVGGGVSLAMAGASVWSVAAVLWALGLAFLTALPWVRTGQWVVRVCDFPRMQIAIVAMVLLVATGVITLAADPDWAAVAAMAILGAVVVVQALYIAPFVPLWPVSVEAASSPTDLRVLVSNLDVDNEKKAAAIDAINTLELDLLVLIEVDERWMRELGGVRGRFEHHLEAVRPDGCGLVLWSRFELRDGRVEFLVDDDRPSVHAWVVLPGGERAGVSAVHPTPPGLEREDDEGRHDSRVRDAELVLLARKIAAKPGSPRLVLGDLNDSAWSRTTRLFLKISGMRDPRLGRGMFPTFPADKPLFRYPIDHVFVSPGFGVRGMRRLVVPGSDHLGIYAEFSLERRGGPEPDADAGDREEAAEIVEEGREDAKE